MQKIKWKKLLLETSIWFIAEIILSLIGIDDLADYSEFLLEQKSVAIIDRVMTTFFQLRPKSFFRL